jgi:hypothetical protein
MTWQASGATRRYPCPGTPLLPLEGHMTTKLEKELRREIEIDGKPYTLTLGPDGMKLTEKGRRKGQELKWKDLISGDTALATALNASLDETGS